MHGYEIEIKTLLGSRKNADALLSKMQKLDSDLKELGEHKQLNHYFINGDTTLLYRNVVQCISEPDKKKFKNICQQTKDFSVRTRQADGDVLIVIKASVDDTSSENGTARIEFESKVDISLEELDKLVLDSGFEYQAKWSRERQEFKYKGMNVTIDKNAGYGYIAEFEKVIGDPAQVENTKTAIRDSVAILGIEELNQDRLARMFDYYNANWQDYYGTEKVFNIE
jgi:adenylate cyclase class IV